MKDIESKLERLLRSAAATGNEPAEMPFGFDTRVVALSREKKDDPVCGLARLSRWVSLAAAAVIVLATVGTYCEASWTNETIEPFDNEFAIADFEIQNEFLP